MLILLSIGTYAFATEDRVQSLEDKLQKATGSDKVTLLNDLSELYLDISPHKSLRYGDEALNLAREEDHNSQIIDSLNSMGMAHFVLANYGEAIKYFDKGIKQEKKSPYPKGLAYSLNGLGLVHHIQGNYEKAIGYFTQALDAYESAGDQQGLAYCLNNIGTIKDTGGQYQEALEYYLQALDINLDLDNKEEVATCYNNIGYVHIQLEYYSEAFEYYVKALRIYEELKQNAGTATVLSNIAEIYTYQEEYELALSNYSKAMEVYMKLEAKEDIANTMNNIGYVYEQVDDYETALKFYMNALEIQEAIGSKEGMINSNNNIGSIYYFLEEPERALTYHMKALELSKVIDYNEGILIGLKNVSYDYTELEQYEEAFMYYEGYSELKDTAISEENRRTVAELEIKYESTKKQHLIDLLEKDNKLKTFRYWLQLGISIGTITILVIAVLLGYIILKEKKKSEKLLLNILPLKVAKDLKKNGKTEPQHFQNVTVYFSDIIGFTKMSSTMEPKALISELNDIFTAFDHIMEAHDCTRIKTIGDAYFAVCGLPEENPNHPQNIINASRAILEYLKERNSTHELAWEIRIGIHSGDVVGGVVGIKKYIYDVFGDTVNTASRMESNSEAMRINISHDTYELVKNDYTCIKRQPLEVKGKGLMDMYFVE